MSRIAKVIVPAVADVTSLMSGITAAWQWEVTDVWVTGATNAFTWTAGVLSVTGYTSGTVLARFNLYLKFGESSGYDPIDPEDTGTAHVYWDERLTGFPTISNSIEKFETGLNKINVGGISFDVDDDWISLLAVPVVFANQDISVYIDDVLEAVLTGASSSVSNFKISINSQIMNTVLREECNFGDPGYLNRIDLTSSNAYYTGSNVPTEFGNYVIPVITGTQSPYNYTVETPEDVGDLVAAPLVPPSRNIASYLPDSGAVMCRLIPISTSSAIVCRIPSYMTVSSTAASSASLGSAQHIRQLEHNFTDAIITSMIPSQICTLEANSVDYGARLLNKFSSTGAYFFIETEDTSAIAASDLKQSNTTMHLLTKGVPLNTYVNPTLVSTALSSGNKLITLTGITGIDLANTPVYCVFSSTSGARSAPKTIEWLLDIHGLTTDATFDTLSTAYPDEVIQQIGYGTNMPKVEDAIAEINRTILTAVVEKADGTGFKIIDVDPTTASSQTIEDAQLSGISVRNEYRDIAETIIFDPKYAISPDTWSDLQVNVTNLNVSAFYGSTRTKTIRHLLDAINLTRFQEIAYFWGSPNTEFSANLLDDSVSFDIGDYITIDSLEFNGKIIITSKSIRQTGSVIKGRLLYDN